MAKAIHGAADLSDLEQHPTRRRKEIDRKYDYRIESWGKICVAGKRCCPPQDCGGPQGFAELLNALQDGSHTCHEEVWVWLGDFDPESFSADEINRRLRRRRKH